MRIFFAGPQEAEILGVKRRCFIAKSEGEESKRERKSDPNENFKVIAHFMPRRRFSQGAVSALKDILENLEMRDGEEKEEEKGMIDPEEFASLSREEQLKVVFEF